MEITVEFREKVDKAARSAASSNKQIDWEDVAQDIWVRMLEDPADYDRLTKMEDPFGPLKRIAKQEIYKQNSSYEHFTGDYIYTSGEVRGLLREYLIDVTLESVAEHVDLVEGLLLLREKNSALFKVLTDKYVHGIEPKDAKYTQRGVDTLTVQMNQVNKGARYSYEGVGSRKVMSNATFQAKSWNQMEQNAGKSGTNRDW